MAVSFSGIASSNVTISGEVTTAAIPLPSSAQTLVSVSATGNSSVQSAYTVPADKIFYLMGVICQRDSTCMVFEDDGTTKVLLLESGAAGQGDTSYTPSCPIKSYTATEVCKVNCTSGFQYTLSGVLVDA